MCYTLNGLTKCCGTAFCTVTNWVEIASILPLLHWFYKWHSGIEMMCEIDTGHLSHCHCILTIYIYLNIRVNRFRAHLSIVVGIITVHSRSKEATQWDECSLFINFTYITHIANAALHSELLNPFLFILFFLPLFSHLLPLSLLCISISYIPFSTRSFQL